jgi:hypothetical protein
MLHFASKSYFRIVVSGIFAFFASINAAGAETLPANTASVTIPYSNATDGPLTALPHITLALDDGKPLVFTMDTGSTGLVVGTGTHAFVPSGPALGAGQITYTSSGITLTGSFYQATVKIGSDENYAIASVPVLLANKLTCASDARDCTPKSDPDTAQFGIGFGRENGGASDRTPAYNAFLNIININGTPVTPSSPSRSGTITSGYIITAQSVTLGLTSTNTQRFKFLGLIWSEIYGDWEPIPGTLTINNTHSVGTVLNDSGVTNMYAQPVTGSDVPTTGPYGACVHGPCLEPGATVSVAIGNPEASPVASYSFTIGPDGAPRHGSAAAAPDYVTLVKEAPTAFINTTYHFFNEFNYIYDYTHGMVGYRKIR